MTEFDFIVVGQGLAGTAMTWALRWHRTRVLVIDREEPATASRVAAGLLTPVTGKRMVPAWRLEDFLPTAVEFYQCVADHTGVRCFHTRSAVRLFVSADEQQLFDKKLSGPNTTPTCRQRADGLVSDSAFDAPYGGFEMPDAGQLDVPLYLDASRDVFRSDGAYIAADLDIVRDVVPDGDHIQIPRFNVSSRHVVFCQGVAGKTNPWFKAVEFDPTCGETITVRIPGLTEDRVIHRGVWLFRCGDDVFRVGATSLWNRPTCHPTAEARDRLQDKLRQFLKCDFEVIDQAAAVRPIVIGRHPIAGAHPDDSRLSILNGLGSKSILQAPLVARQLAGFLVEGTPIDPELDLQTRGARFGWPLGAAAAAHLASSGAAASNPHRAGHSSPARSRQWRSLPPRLTHIAQEIVCSIVRAGETVIDGTAGNGHDTECLARHVGPTGHVFAFDIQSDAIQRTGRRLYDHDLTNVTLLQVDHANMGSAVPPENAGHIGAVMLNLGYLPGGNKDRTTTDESTIAAIQAALRLVRPGGVLTVIAYTGHRGGSSEADAVAECLAAYQSTAVEVHHGQSLRDSPVPRLFVARVAG